MGPEQAAMSKDTSHLDILLQGVEAFNAWREDNPEEIPDFTRVEFLPTAFKDTGLWSQELAMIDLRGINLREAKLPWVKMELVSLAEADLEFAHLRSARIVGCNLRAAKMTGASLADSFLDDVYLRHAVLREAVFTSARLERCNLADCDLSMANLVHAALIDLDMRGVVLNKMVFTRGIMQACLLNGAEIKDADLREAELFDSIFRRASLERSDFDGARLDRAVLYGASLRDAGLNKASLFQADLRHSHLERANLRGADLRKADMQNADLRETKVSSVRYDRWARYEGIRLEGCYGGPQFERFAKDQEFIEEVRGDREQARYWLIYLPWLVSSDCGRSLGLWAMWSLLLAAAFGYKFWLMGPGHFDVARLEFTLSTMVYYSIVTFTTLGFGDIVPTTSKAAMWVTIEVIVGYVMLGGLIAIFSNKLARRS
ncbi:MAG: hypothetical protein D6E12_16920 [Desulfovibrio sp.]|nr:MAG: hypothetical protein D6E12_16920 [Desulfovibrio sp.]